LTIHLSEVGLTVQEEVRLDDIELELRPGQLYVVLGPASAGKTSLLRVIAGLERPTAGRILVDGVDMTGASPRRRNVAMVYRQAINYPAFTVHDNIAAPLRMQKMPKDDIDARVRHIASTLRIESSLHRLPAELPVEQQQRCAIARALARESSLLLLDEPLADLDRKPREELREELRAIFETRDSIVVYGTAEPLEALAMGGTVAIMDGGRVLQVGPASKIHHRPGSSAVARVFSHPPMNMIDVQVDRGMAVSESGLAIPLSEKFATANRLRMTVGVRAEHLSLLPDGNHSIPIEGTVELSEISGSETFVHVAQGRTSWIVQLSGVHQHATGASVTIYLDPSKIFVFGETGALEAFPAIDAQALEGGGASWRE